VAIVCLLAHRDGEGEAEAFDEIALVVAVEDDGVHEADGCLSRVKVQAHHKRQPLTRRVLVNPFHLNGDSHRARVLHGKLLDLAGELRAVVQNADELAVSRDDAIVIVSMSEDGPTWHRSCPVSISIPCSVVSTFRFPAAGTPGARRNGPGSPVTVANPKNLIDPSGQ
jgi:hypothetical protein